MLLFFSFKKVYWKFILVKWFGFLLMLIYFILKEGLSLSKEDWTDFYLISLFYFLLNYIDFEHIYPESYLFYAESYLFYAESYLFYAKSYLFYGESYLFLFFIFYFFISSMIFFTKFVFSEDTEFIKWSLLLPSDCSFYFLSSLWREIILFL